MLEGPAEPGLRREQTSQDSSSVQPSDNIPERIYITLHDVPEIANNSMETGFSREEKGEFPSGVYEAFQEESVSTERLLQGSSPANCNTPEALTEPDFDKAGEFQCLPDLHKEESAMIDVLLQRTSVTNCDAPEKLIEPGSSREETGHFLLDLEEQLEQQSSSGMLRRSSTIRHGAFSIDQRDSIEEQEIEASELNL
jgi:hypothetical protein